MPSKNPAQRLRDILDNLDFIRETTAGLDLTVFSGDIKTAYAVVRALEIVSEASRRLPDEMKARHPAIDWAAVAAVGNVFRHEYETVDYSLVWHTVRHDLTPLRAVVEEEWTRVQES